MIASGPMRMSWVTAFLGHFEERLYRQLCKGRGVTPEEKLDQYGNWQGNIQLSELENLDRDHTIISRRAPNVRISPGGVYAFKLDLVTILGNENF